MNNGYKDPEYHKKYYQEHKAEIAAKRKERQKQAKYKEYKHNYYMAHREEIIAKQKARNAVKKANQNAWITLKTPEKDVLAEKKYTFDTARIVGHIFALGERMYNYFCYTIVAIIIAAAVLIFVLK